MLSINIDTMRTRQKNVLKIISDINGVVKLSENHFLVKSQHDKNLPYKVKPSAYNIKRIIDRSREILVWSPLQ